jgi:hypothetical protein
MCQQVQKARKSLMIYYTLKKEEYEALNSKTQKDPIFHIVTNIPKIVLRNTYIHSSFEKKYTDENKKVPSKVLNLKSEYNKKELE